MDNPIKTLPVEIQEEFRAMAGFLYSDLEFKKSVIQLQDAPEPKYRGHKIRVSIEVPPEWYSNLYYDIQNNCHRRKRIGGTRARILKTLNAISLCMDHKHKRYTYEIICRALIKNMLIKGFEWEGQEIPPNISVVEYFKDKE